MVRTIETLINERLRERKEDQTVCHVIKDEFVAHIEGIQLVSFVDKRPESQIQCRNVGIDMKGRGEKKLLIKLCTESTGSVESQPIPNGNARSSSLFRVVSIRSDQQERNEKKKRENGGQTLRRDIQGTRAIGTLYEGRRRRKNPVHLCFVFCVSNKTPKDVLKEVGRKTHDGSEA